MQAQLRVFPYSTQEEEDNEFPSPTVRVSLGELLPLLAVAKRHNYLWLKDFLDDEVCVTPDLYEVLRAFRSSRRPSA